MSDLHEGLFHLNSIPPFVAKERVFVKTLFHTIRDMSDANGCRNIPTEDFYRSVVSFWKTRNDVYLLRFANVDDKGKPFGSMAKVQNAYDTMKSVLRGAGYEIAEPGHPRYDHFCNPKEFEETDFLFAPDNQYVRTVVVIKR